MSTVNVGAALPQLPLPGLGFTRVPTGMFTAAKWKLFEWLHKQAREHGPEIEVTDQALAILFGVSPQWINECLGWLQGLGYIVRERFKRTGPRVIVRLIIFKIPFAKAKPGNKAGTQPKAGAADKPRAETETAEPVHGPTVARRVLDTLEAKGWSLTVNENRDLVVKRLRDDANPDDVGPDVKLLVKSYKADIIALLESDRE